MLPASARSNQSQETKSKNRIEKEDEKQDENPDHSKIRGKIKDIKESRDGFQKGRSIPNGLNIIMDSICILQCNYSLFQVTGII